MGTDSSREVINADSAGAQIGPMLAGSARWRIAQTYRHCFYCLSGTGDVICIGNASVDRGPFTITCSDRVVTAAAALEGNRSIPSHDGAILLDDQTVIDTTRSALWLADFTRYAGSEVVPYEVLSTLVEAAADTAPQQSFGTLIPALCGRGRRSRNTATISGIVHRQLLQVADVVRRDDAFDDPGRLASLLTPLIGLGYGLTPSGDDFCAGSVLSLIAVGKPEQAAVLAARLFRAAQRRTTAISLAFYRALAASLLSESQARLLGCFGAQQDTDLGNALRGVYRHGATSGWDTLAGFAFGISLFLHENQPSGLVDSAGAADDGLVSGGQIKSFPAVG